MTFYRCNHSELNNIWISSFMVDQIAKMEIDCHGFSQISAFFGFCFAELHATWYYLSCTTYVLRNWLDRNKRRSPDGMRESTKRTERWDKTCHSLSISSNLLPRCYVGNCAINFQCCKENAREKLLFWRRSVMRFIMSRIRRALYCLIVNFRNFRIVDYALFLMQSMIQRLVVVYPNSVTSQSSR